MKFVLISIGNIRLKDVLNLYYPNIIKTINVVAAQYNEY